MFGVLFALENVVLMTQELVLCAAGLVYKKKKGREREREREWGPGYSPGVYSRLSVASLFVQEQED